WVRLHSCWSWSSPPLFCPGFFRINSAVSAYLSAASALKKACKRRDRRDTQRPAENLLLWTRHFGFQLRRASLFNRGSQFRRCSSAAVYAIDLLDLQSQLLQLLAKTDRRILCDRNRSIRQRIE